MNKGAFLVLFLLSNWLMAQEFKETPPNSPLFYYYIANASYCSNPQNYLDKAFNKRRVKVLEHGRAGKYAAWDFYLLLDLDNNRPMVAFSGTKRLRQWGSNLKSVAGKSSRLHRKIEATIDAWQQSLNNNGYGPIRDFIGHSRGGNFAHHIKRDWQVFRITFNGFDCSDGRDEGGGSERVFNLRTMGDICSRKPLSNRKNYITLKQDPGLYSRRGLLWHNHHLLYNFAPFFSKIPDELSTDSSQTSGTFSQRSWSELLLGRSSKTKEL